MSKNTAHFYNDDKVLVKVMLGCKSLSLVTCRFSEIIAQSQIAMTSSIYRIQNNGLPGEIENNLRSIV